MNDHGTTPDEAHQRSQRLWSTGDFSAIGGLHQISSELLCEAVDLHAGERVLDVACGSGNTAIAAARRFCDVVGLDFVPALLKRARERAAAEQLDIAWMVGDAEQLPFDDGSLDIVLSTFGTMFAPDHGQTAAEMVRTCRPGGRIGMANWTPDGWVGVQYATVGKYAPHPPGTLPPTRWGTEAGLRELFTNNVAEMTIERRWFVFRFLTAEHWLDYFRAHLGPMTATFHGLDRHGRQALADELIARISEFNWATDGTLVVPAEYLEVVMTRG